MVSWGPTVGQSNKPDSELFDHRWTARSTKKLDLFYLHIIWLGHFRLSLVDILLTSIQNSNLSQLSVTLQVKNQDSTSLGQRRTNQGRYKPYQGQVLSVFLGIICTGVFFYAITTENFAFIITMGILFGFSIFLVFTVMLNLGGEIIYPEPEVTGSTLILMLANGFTFVMAEILSQLTMKYNIIYRLVLPSLT